MEYAHASSANDDAPGIPEIALWCAVIEQAFVDIGIIVPKNASVQKRAEGRYYDEALRFLLRDNKNFLIVCGLAGVKPEVVRMGARRAESQEEFR